MGMKGNRIGLKFERMEDEKNQRRKKSKDEG
jgi:hypothetical protein